MTQPKAPRETLLAACRGERLGQLPFGARIDLWYNYNAAHDSLPKQYRGFSMEDILRDLRIPFQRRHLTALKNIYHDMDVTETSEPPHVTTTFRTPVGTVSKKLMFTTHEGPWLGYEVEKLFKSPADYNAVRFVIEHTESVCDHEGYGAAVRAVGNDGIVLTSPVGLYCPVQTVMRELMGYETFYYELMDRPAQVEGLIEAVAELQRKQFAEGMKLDMPVMYVCGNWSDDIHTPVFRKYFIPWFREIVPLIHSHDRLAMTHIDGENKRLLPFFRETGIDVWEAWTPSPMTKVTTAELRQALGPSAVVWGGIPAILFEPTYSEDEFEDYIVNTLLREVGDGFRFIVGMGDNLPFDGVLQRVIRVQELLSEHARLPIAN